jgi:CheY-like chemotaxis protein
VADAAWEHSATLFMEAELHHEYWGVTIRWSDREEGSTHPTSKKVILCVDDDAAILQYEKTLLEMSGYAVLAVSSGKHALALATTCELDAVLLDYEMRGMSGQQIAFEIKCAKPRLAIILISGGDVPVDVLTLVDAFILKIEASRTLLPMVANLCSRIPPPGTVAEIR